MSRLETLLEQTEFLLKKQIQAKDHCSGMFAELLTLLEEKIAQGAKTKQDIASLERVHDLLSGQAQKLMDDTQEDSDFLQEQINALRDIRKVEDSAKAKELLDMIIDPEEELLETEEFIAGINEEMAISQESFGFMISDIKDALHEGDFVSVEAMLTNMAAEGDDLDIDLSGDNDDCGDEDCDDEDCGDENEEDGCCGSGACSSGGCGSCPVGCGNAEDQGVDIFGKFNSYDRELAKDLESSDDKSKKSH